jgi:hypothetical protein
MSATLNVYVKDKVTGHPISTARVVALTKNQAIDPPSRMVSGDGGANLYFQGPDFKPPLSVTLLVDAPGYIPWCSATDPTQFAGGTVNVEVLLDPFE